MKKEIIPSTKRNAAISDIIYKDIRIEKLRYLSFSPVFFNEAKLGNIEVSIDAICFDGVCYLPEDKVFENPAHFVWTLLNSEDWEGCLNYSLEEITDDEKVSWKHRHNVF